MSPPAASRRVDLLAGGAAVLAGLAVFGWRVGRPSPWRDEAVTVAVASREVGQILELVRTVDLVHAPFYLLVHALFGAGVTVVEARGVSVVAAALTGAVLYGIGRRAGDRAVGCTAAALWLALPLVSRYAQEARPYALAALLAACSTYVLLRAGAGSRRWWLLYALSLPAVVAVNTLAGLVVPAQLAWLLTGPREVLRRGVVAVSAGALLCVPVVVAAQRQSGQVAFLLPPGPADLTAHLVATAGSRAGVVLLLVAAVGVLLLGRFRRLALLGAVWGVLPLPLLWTLSQVQPLWTTRYLVPTLPGLCLLLAGVAALGTGRSRAEGWPARGWPALLPAAVLVVALAGTGLPRQQAIRGPVGHGEDMRGVARLVSERARPGDAVLFVPHGEYRYRVLAQLYPQALAAVADVALAVDAVGSATLVGVERPAGELPAAVAGAERIWVIGRPGRMIAAGAGDERKLEVLRRDYRPVREWDLRDWTVRLFERR